MKGSDKTAQLKRPLFWSGAAAMLVAAVALPCPLWLTLSVFAVEIAFFWYRRSAVCLLVTVTFLLMAVGYRHLYIDPIRHLDGQKDTVTAVVVETPAYGSMYTVKVTESAWLRRGTRVMLVCRGEETPMLSDVVVAQVRLYAVTDTQNPYADQGAFVRAFPAEYAEKDIVIVGSTERPWARWMKQIRLALTTPCRSVLSETESGILAAVCFGDTSFLREDIIAAFRGSGLSHLLVVSGLHVSMVALALCQLFRRSGRRLSCLLTLAGLWFFAWLVGLSPSVLRAATMASLWLIGRWLFCRADGLNSLGLAALVVLGVNPCAVFHGGCQLSFAATLGVLLLAPRLTPRFEMVYDAPWWHRLWHSLRRTAVSGAAVCLSALLFTLPIAVYHYGGFSLATVVSNVLAVAPVGLMMALGWLGTLCGLIPVLGWLGHGLLLAAGLLARYVGWTAQACSPDWAWVSISHPWQLWLIGGLCLLAVCGILCRVSARRLMAVLAFLSVTVWCIATPLTASSIQLTVLSLDNEGAFIVTQGDRSALLLTHGRELDEVVYATRRLDPDVVFLGDATAEDAGRLNRFPDATVFVAAAAAAATDSCGGVLCPDGGTVTLWDGCRLTVLSADCWRLQVGAEMVYICLDPTAAPIDTDYLCLYVGGTPTYPPRGRYGVVCTRAWLRRHRPTPTGREIFIVEQPITYVPQGGEWRVTPWL